MPQSQGFPSLDDLNAKLAARGSCAVTTWRFVIERKSFLSIVCKAQHQSDTQTNMIIRA